MAAKERERERERESGEREEKESKTGRREYHLSSPYRHHHDDRILLSTRGQNFTPFGRKKKDGMYVYYFFPYLLLMCIRLFFHSDILPLHYILLSSPFFCSYLLSGRCRTFLLFIIIILTNFPPVCFLCHSLYSNSCSSAHSAIPFSFSLIQFFLLTLKFLFFFVSFSFSPDLISSASSYIFFSLLLIHFLLLLHFGTYCFIFFIFPYGLSEHRIFPDHLLSDRQYFNISNHLLHHLALFFAFVPYNNMYIRSMSGNHHLHC